jgi:hypothetical protein
MEILLARAIHTDIQKQDAYTETGGIRKKKTIFLLRGMKAYKSVKIYTSPFVPPLTLSHKKMVLAI